MKICIARVDRMGDMILTLPIIKGLKILDKSNIIHVIASDRNYKIAKHFNYIDKIYLLSSSKKNFFSIINKIRKEKYDYFFNFSPNWSGYFLGIFSAVGVAAVFSEPHPDPDNPKAAYTWNESTKAWDEIVS